MMDIVGREAEFTGYCGLYCGDCIRYRSKASDLARALLNELQATEFGKYAEVKSCSVKELEQYRQCCQVLEAIIGLQCNEPCRVGGGCTTFSCKILQCCQRRGYQGCWECDDLEKCNEFEFLKPFHGEAPVKNIRKIRELGLDGWTKHRQKLYTWQ
ncbi:DUF3795 domain-containing protein [Chloroflexota bacterium]